METNSEEKSFAEGGDEHEIEEDERGVEEDDQEIETGGNEHEEEEDKQEIEGENEQEIEGEDEQEEEEDDQEVEEGNNDIQGEEEDENEELRDIKESKSGGDNIKKKVKGKAADKKCIPGIIYIGHVPPRLRPKHMRNMLSAYGEIGRIFLQPEDRQLRARKKKSGMRRCDFTEGWVEYRDKRIAKRVALSLHNTPMANKKGQRFAADLWSMKYLHRFQWTHLSERLSYEMSVLKQRLRTEVSQAKKETNFFMENIDKSAHMERKRKRDGPQEEEKKWDFTQRQTEEEIQSKKKKKDSGAQKRLDNSRHIQEKSRSNVSLLAKIFNSSPAE